MKLHIRKEQGRQAEDDQFRNPQLAKAARLSRGGEPRGTDGNDDRHPDVLSQEPRLVRVDLTWHQKNLNKIGKEPDQQNQRRQTQPALQQSGQLLLEWIRHL